MPRAADDDPQGFAPPNRNNTQGFAPKQQGSIYVDPSLVPHYDLMGPSSSSFGYGASMSEGDPYA